VPSGLGREPMLLNLGDKAIKEGFIASPSSTRKIEHHEISLIRNFLNPLKYFSTNTRASMVEDF
jgi:hypothetical protein